MAGCVPDRTGDVLCMGAGRGRCALVVRPVDAELRQRRTLLPAVDRAAARTPAAGPHRARPPGGMVRPPRERGDPHAWGTVVDRDVRAGTARRAAVADPRCTRGADAALHIER